MRILWTATVWLAACAMAMVTGGCTPSRRPAEATQGYFQDAGQCSRQSQITGRVRVRTAGFRDDVPLKLGVNPDAYKQCMENLGWAEPDPAKDPYWELAARCRREARRGKPSLEDTGMRIKADLDETAYRNCMHHHGVEGEVIVQPLQVQPQ